RCHWYLCWAVELGSFLLRNSSNVCYAAYVRRVRRVARGRAMHRSNNRILTTHVGSLPRPPALRDLLIRYERGESIDRAEFRRQIEAAVRRVVVEELGVGIDIGNNGEQPRVGFQTYVAGRMQGFGGASARPTSMDVRAFPDYGAMLRARRSQTTKIDNAPQALAEVHYTDLSEAAQECELFQHCLE